MRGDPRPTIGWWKNGLLLVPNNRYHMKHEEDGTCQLIIEHPLKFSDSGRYICRATNSGGVEECLQFVRFQGKQEEDHSLAEYRRTQKMMKSRHVQPEDEDSWEKQLYHSKRLDKKKDYDHRYKLNWLTRLTDKVIPQGSTLRFVAFIDGKYPQFEWYHGDIPLVHSRKYRTFVLKDGKGCLIVNNVQSEDSGTYKLIVKNYANSIECEAKVTVYDYEYKNFEPPLFISTLTGKKSIFTLCNWHRLSLSIYYDIFIIFVLIVILLFSTLSILYFVSICIQIITKNHYKILCNPIFLSYVCLIECN